jgi:hypothetical protein
MRKAMTLFRSMNFIGEERQLRVGRTRFRALELLMADCMNELGFDYQAQSPAAEPENPINNPLYAYYLNPFYNPLSVYQPSRNSSSLTTRAMMNGSFFSWRR